MSYSKKFQKQVKHHTIMYLQGWVYVTGLPLLGLPLQGVKSGYKAYKQHKSEKELRSRSTRGEIQDPSYEFEAVAIPAAYSPFSELTQASNLRRKPSSASMSSMSSTDVEAYLENDVEFQQFMNLQRQAWLSQQRSMRDCSSNENALLSPTPTEPPTYASAMAQAQPIHTPPSYVSPVQECALFSSNNHYINDSPVSSIHELEASELDVNTFHSRRPSISSVESICELPGNSRVAVELPTDRV